MVVLVTGASGQLGQSLQSVAKNYPQVVFHFYNSSALDITDLENCRAVFSRVNPGFCINAAAYTAVDKAESEPEKAHLVNVTGSENIAIACREHDTVLLHISTDFVFDGTSVKPYREDDIPNPAGVYGQTKLDGEKIIQKTLEAHYIIRTSWVYSGFGSNFMKTMLRLGHEKESLSVVDDQIGTPTNAVDLAEALLSIIIKHDSQPQNSFGIYHYSNQGQCSWYEFARQIFEINKIDIDLRPIPTSSYPTPAKRPGYSVLDKSKIKSVFGIDIKNWQISLKNISE